MARSQIELLVMYQDIDLMLQEITQEERDMGFKMKGSKELEKAKKELEKKIKPQFLRSYQRLSTRYKYSIAPVKDGTCLGCFAKLPTSHNARGKKEETIYKCENCGRILYWIE